FEAGVSTLAGLSGRREDCRVGGFNVFVDTYGHGAVSSFLRQSSRLPGSPPGNEFHGAYSESPLKED
ncbi:hypothetical protein, partial [Microcoleus sp. D3_18_C2]|uniref:hypothetical protein n=1 Tax=Microcoleus sp. D3_18_C2 TaxID=3055334 RepID=UPI002FD33F90